MPSALEEPVVEQVLYKLNAPGRGGLLLSCKTGLGFIPKRLIYSFNWKKKSRHPIFSVLYIILISWWVQAE